MPARLDNGINNPFADAGTQPHTNMRLFIAILLWTLLLVLCWPLALLALIAFPVAWLIALPFRLGFLVVEALCRTLRALLLAPARLLGEKV